MPCSVTDRLWDLGFLNNNKGVPKHCKLGAIAWQICFLCEKRSTIPVELFMFDEDVMEFNSKRHKSGSEEKKPVLHLADE